MLSLEASINHKSKVIAQRRKQDSNFDETAEGQIMNESLNEDLALSADERERLHQEKAAFYLTEAGKKHLQEIIDDPNSSPKEVLDAQIHHRTALAREKKDKEVMKIVKDEDLDVIDKEQILQAKLGNVDAEISRVGERLKVINENYEKIQERIERHRIRGEEDEARELTKVARSIAEEGRYLSSYKHQLKSHKANVERYLNRKQRDEEKQQREALQAERAEQAQADRAKAERRNNRHRRAQKFDRFFEKLVRRVIMDWM